MRRRAPRLVVETLSDRIVPAFDLAIDGDLATSNVSTTSAGGTTTFTATGPGATLNVAAIETALLGDHVEITTGAAGAQAGDITWTFDSPSDDLEYSGFDLRTLTLRPSASATGGTVTISDVFLAFQDNVDLLIDTTRPTTDGDIVLSGFTGIFEAHQATLSAGTGTVQLGGTLNTNSGAIFVVGSTVFGGSAILTAGDFATINGAVDLSVGGLSVTAGTNLTLNGTVNGARDLALSGAQVALNGAVGGTTPLNSLTFAGGTITTGANPVSAASVTVGDGDLSTAAVYGVATGTLTGTVTVSADGALAPGGVGGSGTLSVTGDLIFDGGTYSLDVGAATDQVVVSGDVQIFGGSTLGDSVSTGALTAADGEKKIIDFGGTLTGVFDNAATEGTKIVLGTDAVEVTHYGPAATGVTVRQASREANNTAIGSDADGTGYTIKLTGPGDLVRARDEFGGLFLILRNTTDKSSVAVSTKVNASDDVFSLAGVSVTGRLGTFSGKKASLDGPFAATGSVKSIALGNSFGPITLGGGTADKTAVTMALGFSDITTPGTLSITTTGAFGGDVNANALGAVKVGGTLFGTGPTWDINNGITSLTAADIQGLLVNAAFIGTLATTGGGPTRVAGDIVNAVIVLDGSNAGFGLKTLTAKGTVRNSLFDVQTGNVSAVTVGRFIDSQLFLRYTPGLDFTAGAFTGTATLGKFTTTAKVIGDAANPLNWAFSGGQVAASILGSVRLSGLKTVHGADPFGFKFSTAGGSVQTTFRDDVSVPLKSNLTPDLVGVPDALAGDFFYFDATP